MGDTQAPLLRDLITIPERVHQGDFVLKLSEGVSDAHAEETVKNYVVTDQLRKSFDDALGFIQCATEERKSAACYLHGSFGSGKSHFMAVLNLLLAGNPRARAISELAPVVDRHNAWNPASSLPDGAFPHDRRAGRGKRSIGGLCRACTPRSSRGAGARVLSG